MRRAAAVFLPLLSIVALAMWRAQGPEPQPASAAGFSAVRAMDVLRDLLAENVPHPIGTPANARVRDRIVARLRAMHYEVEIQRRFACNASATCGMVENILARQPGARREDVVLLAAHYDSVGAGPGASDDGMGVATLLETARVLGQQRFRNPVALLITDGEESGLLGAEAFVADEKLAAEVAVAINVEMRGTYGTSNLFETSQGNRWLVRHLAKTLERPQATSLSYAVYTLLPNDTDVTIFKRAGKAAVNFAAIGGVNWYHTPYDDVAHASLRTLQHHGDNALGSVRALANADLGARSRTDATFFDVLGFFLVWWPQEWTLWMAVAGLVLLVVGARRTPPREMTFGVLTAFTAILFSVLLGTGVGWLTRVRSEGQTFVARPELSVAAMWLTGGAAALLAAALFRRRARPLAMLYGTGIVWQMIGIALALTIPGAAYQFVVPAVAMALCAVAGLRETATGAIAASAAAVLMVPGALLLYETLGGPMMASIAGSVGLMATLFAPLFPSLRGAIAVAALALLCAVGAMFQPPYTSERPRRISVSHVDDGSPRWIVPVRIAPELQPYKDPLRGDGWSMPAPPVAPRVEMTATRNGEQLVVRVRSSRGADRLTLLLKGDVTVLRVNGVAPAPRPGRFREPRPGEWRRVAANAVDDMVVECRARGRVEAVASDVTFGVPPTPLLAKRNAATAFPTQDGDVTITRRQGTL
ncbi:MAG TPA: M28 family peptidase, partial [Thermoanaerobaculia bacterium]|nr:M28 family peptidase [Thermoanaerobaculia bacterium]